VTDGCEPVTPEQTGIAPGSETSVPHRKTLHILVGIDTDAVRRAYPNPSKDSKSPTPIAHHFGYMVCTGTHILSGQGTGNLHIRANVGDTVRAFATSGSNNFEDTVLLYGLPGFEGTEVMKPFHYRCLTRSTVLPRSDTTVLPERTRNERFWFHESTISQVGTEGYKVWFALYTRDAAGVPQLLGHYEWTPSLTVTA
jgi:nematocidal protein AidA